MKILKALFIIFTFIALGLITLIIYKSTGIFAGRITLSPFADAKNTTKFSSPDLNIAPNPILKDKNGYTTILLVGVDSRGARSGLMNTDSIMSITYSWKNHKVFIISYPRDLYIKYPNTYYHFKINAVYAYGQRVFHIDGMEYLKKAIKEVSGLDIQYQVLIDFKGFVDLINLLGGVRINIPRSFTDYMYPTPNGGYQTVHFDKGWHTLSGEKALIFARSRHAAGPEGSDFARAARQQLIIKAIANQVKDQVKKDPAWAFRIFQKITTYVHASKVSPNEVKTALEIFQKQGMPPIYSQVLTPATASYTLLQSQANPLYIIVPRAGIDNWTYVHAYIKLFMTYPSIITKQPTITIEYHSSASANQSLNDYNTLKGKFSWLTIYYPKYNKTQISNSVILYKPGFKESAQELSKIIHIPDLQESKAIKTSILIRRK